MTDLLTNQLVEIPAEGVVLRILWVDPLGRSYQVIDVQSDTVFPVFRASGELAALIDEGSARVSETDPWLAPLVDTHLPEHYRVKRDEAWELIAPHGPEQSRDFQTQRSRQGREEIGQRGQGDEADHLSAAAPLLAARHGPERLVARFRPLWRTEANAAGFRGESERLASARVQMD
ncbi:MAG: hypothetical protein AB7G62_12110 [Magnetospirillum sp.]